jgi:hypothetical protein
MAARQRPRPSQGEQRRCGRSQGAVCFGGFQVARFPASTSISDGHLATWLSSRGRRRRRPLGGSRRRPRAAAARTPAPRKRACSWMRPAPTASAMATCRRPGRLPSRCIPQHTPPAARAQLASKACKQRQHESHHHLAVAQMSGHRLTVGSGSRLGDVRCLTHTP